MENSYGVVLKRALDSYYVPLNRKKTNGHDFCELIVDLEKSRFTAILYGGECYTYCYSTGVSKLEDLIVLLRNENGSLYRKLANPSHSNFVDIELTANNIREIISEFEDIKEEVEELIENLEGYTDLSIESFYDVWYKLFDTLLRDEILPEDAGSVIVNKIDFQCKVFCELVAPILADFLTTQI